MWYTRLSFVVAVLLCAALLSGDALAQNDFYGGKRINFVVGSTPGSTLDSYARLIAQNVGNFIPGRPTSIVQNMAGAASLTAVRYLDATAPQDGTVIVAFNPGLLLSSITDPERFKVKFSEFAWLGSPVPMQQVCFMWGTTGVKTWDDLLKRELVVMGDTGGGSSYVQQKMLEKIFGVKLKQVLGYPGTAEKLLAIERGELDGDCTSWSNITPDWLAQKRINVVIRFQDGALEGLNENVPYARDLVKDPDKKKLLDLLNVSADVGRPFILSKSVPVDRVGILRDAFDRMVKDPSFLAVAKAQKLNIVPASGRKVEEMLKSLYSSPPAIIAAAKEILGN
jgi:tripartite-type tricarboxylate transporter receptor subunit TctC